MMNHDHLHPEFRFVMALSDAERIEFLDRPRWIGYPQADRILDTLKGLMNKPEKPRMPNLLIVGDPNNGKTTIVRRFYDLCGQSYVDEEPQAIKPVLLAQAPPSADEKGLYASILECFLAPYRPTDPALKLRYQVVHLMRRTKCRILLIDEFHSFLTGTPLKQREVMNAIKFLCNELAIPIVGIGTGEAVRVLHTDPQHASRFPVVRLPRWELNVEFRRLLAGFELVLPLKKKSGLSDLPIASALHAISEGNLGNLHTLLMECAREAIRDGSEAIAVGMIQNKAWVQPTRGIQEVML